MKRINCLNAKQIDKNPYVEDNNLIKIGEKFIHYQSLPKLDTDDDKFDMYYLNFGNLLYFVIEDFNNKIASFYIIEQKIEDGKVIIENIYTTTIVPDRNVLCDFFKYNETWERNNILTNLCENIDYHLNYVMNSEKFHNDIELCLNNIKEAQKLEESNKMLNKFNKNFEKPKMLKKINKKINLKELAKQTGIPYNTLWNRINRAGMTVEEATAKPPRNKEE